MPFIQYVGPFDAVDVPRWQIGNALRATPIEVSQEAADDLLGQVANWAPAKAPKNTNTHQEG